MGTKMLNWVHCISIFGELKKVWISLSGMGTNMLNWVHYTPKLFWECLSLREPARVCTTENPKLKVFIKFYN